MSGWKAKGKDAVKYVVSTKGGKNAMGGIAVEGVKAISETHGNLLAGVLDLAMADEDPAVLDNPFFTQNGHDGPSPNTQRYLQAKKLLGTMGTIGTSLLDIGGITSGAGAIQNSVIWYKIDALFEKMIPPSRRAKAVVYQSWFSYEVAKKAVPAGSLETQMLTIIKQKMYSTAGGATKTGIAFGTGGLLGIFVNAVGAQLQEKLDSLFGQDVMTLARGLHWYAYRESVVGGAFGGGKGPAMRILEIIWEQYAYGKGSGVSLKDVTQEPQGWLVIADLLA